MATCISCGYENDNIASFCLSCGHDLSELRKRDLSGEELGDLEETKMESQSEIKDADLPDMPQSEPLMYPTPMPMDYSEATSALQSSKSSSEKCSVCGSLNLKGMKFCGNCGSPMGDIQPGRTQALPTNVVNQALRSICKLVSVEMGGKEGPTFLLDKEIHSAGAQKVTFFFTKTDSSPLPTVPSRLKMANFTSSIIAV